MCQCLLEWHAGERKKREKSYPIFSPLELAIIADNYSRHLPEGRIATDSILS